MTASVLKQDSVLTDYGLVYLRYVPEEVLADTEIVTHFSES